MRRYRVTVDGRTYEVEIDDPGARPVVARIEGHTFVVDVESGRLGEAPPSIGSGVPSVVPAPILTARRRPPASSSPRRFQEPS